MMDANEVLWVATEYGINYKKGDEWYEISKKDGLIGDAVYDIIEDPNGRTWAFIRKNLRFTGLNMIKNGNTIAFDKNKLKIKGKVEKLVWHDGKLIAFSEKGVSYFNESEKWVSYGKEDGIMDTKFTEFLKDKHGKLWLASESSLYSKEKDGWKRHRDPESWMVTEMLLDVNETIWLGTEKKGVYSFKDGQWHSFNIENGLIDNEVLEMFEDKQSNIWIVTKKGLSIISGK